MPDEQWKVAKLVRAANERLHTRCEATAKSLFAREAGAHANVDAAAELPDSDDAAGANAGFKAEKGVAAKSKAAAGNRIISSILDKKAETNNAGEK